MSTATATRTAERALRSVHGRFTSGLHDERVAARLGLALGITFGICAATGGYSHLLQQEPSWLDLPARPAGLYRVTQGIHVTTGMATIPLLLAKLWVVAPKLVEWPPARSPGHLLERLALLPLVGGGIFLLLSGTANVARWYPWPFFFPTAHLWAAWLTMGALIVHIGATWATTRRALARAEVPAATVADRRRLLGGVALTSAIVAVSTAGGSTRWLSPVSWLSQRRAGEGPQGLPVNKTAASAGVLETARAAEYRLVVRGAVSTPLELTIAELRALPQRTAVLPIACVEGWSASARWTGVPVRDLLRLAGAPADSEVHVVSLQPTSRYSSSWLNPHQASDADTLLAVDIDGEELHIDHGFPVRLIGPGRPGVAQTKWVRELVVS